MSHATSAPSGTSPPPLQAVPVYRVIYHAQVCPECGSDDITESEVETGEGITEIALTCRTCGTAWPVACVVEWSTPR
jgi:translation initiation factor 2 beta subunit (eIF-2beta)/eIF-5